MKKIMIIGALLMGFSAISRAQGNVTELEELQIGYPNGQELPAGVVLGVDGHVYIQSGEGTRVMNDDFKDLFLLFVEKGIIAEDHAVLASSAWLADYVFEPNYQMRTLQEMEAYVKAHKHLPDVIGQAQLDKQGHFSVNKMLIGQLQNLEELVLHTIAQEKKIKSLEAQIAELEKLAESLEADLKTSEK